MQRLKKSPGFPKASSLFFARKIDIYHFESNLSFQIVLSHLSETITLLILQAWSLKPNHQRVVPSIYFKTTLSVKNLNQKSVLCNHGGKKTPRAWGGPFFICESGKENGYFPLLLRKATIEIYSVH